MAKQVVRANPPICWICDRRLCSNGWVYETVVDEEGRKRPVHVACKEAEDREKNGKEK